MNARARWTSLAGAGVVALVALSGVSCKKGDVAEPTSPITVSEFKATAEGHAGDGKTGLTGRDVYWTDGDDAKVFSNSNIDGVRYVAYGSFGADEIDFKVDEGATGVSGSEFYAVYPYGAAGSFSSGDKTVSVTIPGVQTYNEAGGFANGANVMAAYTTSDNLAFAYKNVCGVLRLKLTGSATVRTITVRSKDANDKLNGTGTITFTNGSPSLSISSGGSAVCLSCPNGVRLTSEGVEFNLVVAQCSMTGGFDVTVVCEEGTFQTSSNHNNPIDAGKILGMPPVHVTAVSHYEDGVLPGEFSVSDTKKVRFSKGNLYYDENTGQWRFEDSQYDFRTYGGNTNADTKGKDACIGGVIGSTPAGQWGLFGWSAKKSDGITPYASGSVYGMLTSTTNNPDYGSTTSDKLMDWGDNSIANGGANTWRTLTGRSNGEWNYLLTTRTTSYGTDSRRYAEVMVCGIRGMLLFPDSFSSWPSNAGSEPTKFNENSSNWNNNVDYTAEQFAFLEQDGCVFLPCAGHRDDSSVNNVNSRGNYWSSTVYSSDAAHAYYLHFLSSDVNSVLHNDRFYGRSVRLVHPL